MTVRLGPVRTFGGLVMLVGGLMLAGLPLFVLMVWKQPSTSGLMLVFLFLPVAIGGLFFFLVGLSLFSNEIAWTVDSGRVSCRSRFMLKQDVWSEPLRNYASLRMVSGFGGSPAFEIILEHSGDPEKNVSLYASNSHPEFRERGSQLATALKLRLVDVTPG